MGTEFPRQPFFNSLRTKLVLFISLIIIGVCSVLSWYFVDQQKTSMELALRKTGTLLIKNLVHNGRYSLITQDEDSLRQVVDGALSVDEVVYVVVTGPDGKRLVEKTKGMLNSLHRFTRNPERALYPDPAMTDAAFSSSGDLPQTTIFTVKDQHFRLPANRGKAGDLPTNVIRAGETIYDFALPVTRRPGPLMQFGPLSLESHEESQDEAHQLEMSTQKPEIYGIFHVGLTQSFMVQTLESVIWNVTVMAIVIILLGIAVTMMLANQIITPLRKLAVVAKHIAAGDLSASVEAQTRDEVGQLTISVNQMTASLKQREQAISTYVETITKQISQLSVMNQTGAVITSTLDVDRLLTTVLKLLVGKPRIRKNGPRVLQPRRTKRGDLSSDGSIRRHGGLSQRGRDSNFG